MKKEFDLLARAKEKALQVLDSVRKCIEGGSFRQARHLLIRDLLRAFRILDPDPRGVYAAEGLLKKAALKLIDRNPLFAEYYDALPSGELDALGIDGILFKTNGKVIPIQAKRSKIRVRGHYLFTYKNEETEKKRIFRFHEFVIAIEIPHCKEGEEDVVAEELSYDLEKIDAEMEKNPSLSPFERHNQGLFPYHTYK